MLIYRERNNTLLPVSLTKSEMERAHDLYLKDSFEQDFVNRYRERCADETGLCNLPKDSLWEQQSILEQAYICYQDIQDCNVAYNDTLEAVIEEMERRMIDGKLTLIPQETPVRVAVVIEDGVVSATYSSSPNLVLEITEIDKNYACCEQRDSVYESYARDASLVPCTHLHRIPGYEESAELEVNK